MKKLYFFASAAVVALAAAGIVTGCDDSSNPLDQGDKLLEQCGLGCNENALAEGNANISGVANIDAFFGSVVNYTATADLVAEGITAPIARIKAQLGVPEAGGAAEIQAAMKAKFHLDGNVKIVYAPPKCEVSAKATLEASAKCDASVKGPSAEVKCTGRCEADVQVSGGKVSCEGGVDVHCTAPSANVTCSGSCKGSCNLEVAAECTGTCNGTCEGTCEVKNTDGSCAGKCEGTCKGKCELSAGGSCTGKCEGECAVVTKSGECTGGAKVECFAEPPQGSAEVKCDAKCSGEVTPPEVKAECKASAKADAEMKAECTPPSIEVDYGFAAGFEANAENTAAFEAFLGTFKTEMAAVVAGLKRANLVLNAGAAITASIDDVTTSFSGAVNADGNLKVYAGLLCAGKLMPKVAGQLTASTTNLTAKVKASGELVAAFK